MTCCSLVRSVYVVVALLYRNKLFRLLHCSKVSMSWPDMNPHRSAGRLSLAARIGGRQLVSRASFGSVLASEVHCWKCLDCCWRWLIHVSCAIPVRRIDLNPKSHFNPTSICEKKKTSRFLIYCSGLLGSGLFTRGSQHSIYAFHC